MRSIVWRFRARHWRSLAVIAAATGVLVVVILASRRWHPSLIARSWLSDWRILQGETVYLRPGDAVLVFGLLKASHLNGEFGSCGDYDIATSRWLVHLRGGGRKMLRADNLVFQPHGLGCHHVVREGGCIVVKSLTDCGQVVGQLPEHSVFEVLEVIDNEGDLMARISSPVGGWILLSCSNVSNALPVAKACAIGAEIVHESHVFDDDVDINIEEVLSNPVASGRATSSPYAQTLVGTANAKEHVGSCLICLEPIGCDPRKVVNLCDREPPCHCLLHRSCYIDPDIEMTDQLRKCMICHSPAKPDLVRERLRASRSQRRS